MVILSMPDANYSGTTTGSPTVATGVSGDTVSVASGATLEGAGLAWQSSIVTAATLTAEAGKGYWIDTTSNACTVTFPGSASVGDQIILTRL